MGDCRCKEREAVGFPSPRERSEWWGGVRGGGYLKGTSPHPARCSAPRHPPRRFAGGGYLLSRFVPNLENGAVENSRLEMDLHGASYKFLRFSNPQIDRELDAVMETLVSALKPDPTRPLASRGATLPFGEG